MSEEKTEEKQEEFVVVQELPAQPTNKAVTKDGKEVTLITVDEALTEMFRDIKSIKKAVA